MFHKSKEVRSNPVMVFFSIRLTEFSHFRMNLQGDGQKKKKVISYQQFFGSYRFKIASCKDKIRKTLEKVRYERHPTNIMCVKMCSV